MIPLLLCDFEIWVWEKDLFLGVTIIIDLTPSLILGGVIRSALRSEAAPPPLNFSLLVFLIYIKYI